jgi:hypothetical protein
MRERRGIERDDRDGIGEGIKLTAGKPTDFGVKQNQEHPKSTGTFANFRLWISCRVNVVKIETNMTCNSMLNVFALPDFSFENDPPDSIPSTYPCHSHQITHENSAALCISQDLIVDHLTPIQSNRHSRSISLLSQKVTHHNRRFPSPLKNFINHILPTN